MQTLQEFGKTIFCQIGTRRNVSYLRSNSSVRDSRTRVLWWNGVPSARRGNIWYATQ